MAAAGSGAAGWGCRRPITRRWLVVEGISWHHGDLAPLDQIHRLKEQYRFRLIVDESLAVGVLGATGRGACEHWGLQPGQVEVVCGSLGHALGSVGGFCVGERQIVDHQRLAGLGYCFSASLPPYLATAAQCFLGALKAEGPALLPRVRANAAELRRQLAAVPGVSVEGAEADAPSPFVHVAVDAHRALPAPEAARRLDGLAEALLRERRVLVAVHRVSQLDKCRRPPSLRLAVTADHSQRDITEAVEALRWALTAPQRPP